MRTFVSAAMMTAMLTAPGFAQNQEENKNPLQLQYEREVKDRQEVAKDYDATMRRTKVKTAPVQTDPWQTVRPASQPATKR